jgi:hypothetical protein
LTLDFKQSGAASRSQRRISGRRSSPWNLRARGVQIRLFLAIAAILSFFSIGEALLDGRFSREFEDADQLPPRQIETSLPAKRPRSASDLSLVHLPADSAPWSEPTTSQENANEVLDEIGHDFWRHLYDSLTVKQRDYFQAALRFALRHAPSPLGTSDASELWTNLERQAIAYEQTAKRELEGLSLERRTHFTKALDEILATWRSEFAPPIKAILKQETLPSDAKPHLQKVLLKWRNLALSEVRDDISSPSEDFVAWFGAFDQMMHDDASFDDFDLDDAQQPSYADLFDQSAQFRGKPVLVRGEIKSCEFQKAQNNLYGIKGYQILWIRPSNYPDAPLKIVSLSELPANEETAQAKVRSLVGKECEVRGLYFKRMAYQAQDNIRAVPTVLCVDVNLLPQDDQLATSNQYFTLGVLLALAAVIAVVLLVLFLSADHKRKTSLPEKLDLPISKL